VYVINYYNIFSPQDFLKELTARDDGKTYLVTTHGFALRAMLNYLYDDPDPAGNILGGYIDFSDGSRVEFGPLKKEGGATKLSFPERRTEWMEVVITGYEGEAPGLCEIEAFCESPDAHTEMDTYLMAADGDGNLVYDYILHDSDTARFSIGKYPLGTPLCSDEVNLSLDGRGKAGWDEDELVITCEKGSRCEITVSDGVSSVTFTISNPSNLEYAYMRMLRFAESIVFNIRYLLYAVEYYAARLSIFR